MARALGVTDGKQSRWMIVAAILFAGIAAVLVFAALRGGDDGSSTSGATTETVVASGTIGANERITEDMLEVRAIPDGQVLSGSYTDTQAVVGLVARYPVQPGEQVTTAKIGTNEIEDENDLGLVIPPGKRGFSVDAAEVTSVGGLLLAGNRVDVLVVFPDTFAGIQRLVNLNTSNLEFLEDVRAGTLFQNIEVLAVAQESQEPLPAPSTTGDDAPPSPSTETSGTRPDDIERQPDARTVTLAVSPQQATILALLTDTGARIWLSLRPAGDDSITPRADVDLTRFIN